MGPLEKQLESDLATQDWEPADNSQPFESLKVGERFWDGFDSRPFTKTGETQAKTLVNGEWQYFDFMPLDMVVYLGKESG